MTGSLPNPAPVDAWALVREAEELLRSLTVPVSDPLADEAIRKLEAALASGGSDPELALRAGVLLVQVSARRTLDVETERLLQLVERARVARVAGAQLGKPEPLYSAACAALGAQLFRVADRLVPNERHEAVGEAVELLREAIECSLPTDPERDNRAADLAAALSRPVPYGDPREVLARLDEAVDLYAALLEGGNARLPMERLTEYGAHSQQQRAEALRRTGNARDAAEAVEVAARLYGQSITLHRAMDRSPGGARMGLARLKFEASLNPRDDPMLDEAIAVGEEAVAELAGDTRFEREAMMQLAGMYAERARRRHRPADAALADALSRDAVRSWHHEPGSIEMQHAKERRLDVLCLIALSDVGTDSHIMEVDDLLQELYGSTERTPQMKALAAMARIATIRSAAGVPEDVYGALLNQANEFEQILRANDFADVDPAWWIRWFGAHCGIARWAEWIGIDRSVWYPPLLDASDRMTAVLRTLNPGTETHSLGHLQLGEVAVGTAIAEGDAAEAHRALRLLNVARHSADVLGITNRIRLGIEGSFVCEILGDPDAAGEWISLAGSALRDFERSATAPLAARLAVERPGYELAGIAAVLAAGAQELAWVMHSTMHLVEVKDSTKAAFRAEIESLSHSITIVFIAQSRLRCRAAVVSRAAWTLVELPDLTLDRVGALIKDAHTSHQNAQSGELSTRIHARDLRVALNQAVVEGIGPLAELLAEGRGPIALRLAGWLHAVPVAPILMHAIGHARTVAVALGIPNITDAPAPRTRRFVALAEPGNGGHYPYLARAVDDVETVATMYSSEPVLDATVDDATAALTTAEMVLIAAHGVSSEEPELAHVVLHDGDLTAGAILEFDLRGLNLVVVAACEALATDRIAPEHPFSVQAALARAGAAATCGPLWTVDDELASRFTRVLFEKLVDGDSVVDAYGKAAALVQDSFDHLDFTLLVRHESAMRPS